MFGLAIALVVIGFVLTTAPVFTMESNRLWARMTYERFDWLQRAGGLCVAAGMLVMATQLPFLVDLGFEAVGLWLAGVSAALLFVAVRFCRRQRYDFMSPTVRELLAGLTPAGAALWWISAGAMVAAIAMLVASFWT